MSRPRLARSRRTGLRLPVSEHSFAWQSSEETPWTQGWASVLRAAEAGEEEAKEQLVMRGLRYWQKNGRVIIGATTEAK